MLLDLRSLWEEAGTEDDTVLGGFAGWSPSKEPRRKDQILQPRDVKRRRKEDRELLAMGILGGSR